MNYVENVAKMLGVEMYEHFCLTDYNGKRLKGKFQFTDHGLVCFHRDTVFTESYTEIFHKMIVGTYKVKKCVWHPQIGDTYYSCCSSNDVNFSVWKNSVRDKELFALGNVFKTSAEAKKATTKYVDFLDSIEPMERWRA